MQIISHVGRARSALAALRGAAPKRPIVILQSDDWGRVGAPSLESLERLRSRNIMVGGNLWDYYGLESEEDVTALGDVLTAARDKEGNSACLTANFIMANADLRAMRATGYTELRWIGIADGFPAPWTEKLLPVYLANIERKAFYPGLHGFTHFNIPQLMRTLASRSAKGDLARALTAEDIPYLASLTPEYNFALLTREREGRFLDEDEQASWIRQGVALFRNAFGFSPRTTCAPGYRANDTTFRIWKEVGIEIVQSGHRDGIEMNGGLLKLNRNVHFEPALAPKEALDKSLGQAERAVARGNPIIISTHSINYITRHLGRARDSREMLRRLLSRLLQRFSDLRFSSVVEFGDAYKRNDPDWFRSVTAKEQAYRMAAAMRSTGSAVAGPVAGGTGT